MQIAFHYAILFLAATTGIVLLLMIFIHEQFLAKLAFWLSLSALLMIELLVRFNGGAKYDTELWVHIAIALIYSESIFELAFKPQRVKNRIELTVGVAFASFSALCLLGIPMLFQRL